MNDQPDQRNLYYILIATETKPLASYSKFIGDFDHICESMLSRVTPNSSTAIDCGDYFIFFLNENNFTYLIMTIPTYPKATAVGCLNSIKKEFETIISGRDFSNEENYCLSEELKEKLKMKFDFYNEHIEVTSESIENLKNELLKMKDEVFKAAEELKIRGEKVENLQEKAQNLEVDSNTYVKRAAKVNKKEKNTKIWYTISIIIALIIIVYVVISLVCGSFTFQCGD